MKYLTDIRALPIKRFALLLLLMGIVCGTILGQNRKELEEKRKQLQAEINQTSGLLEKTQKDKAAALDRYFALQNQIQKRRQLIQTLQSEIVSADTAILRANQIRITLDDDLNRLRQEYASTMRYTMRHRISGSFALFLFSARDLNDAFQRWQYIRQYYSYRQRQAQRILDTQQTLTQKTVLLEQEKTEKARLLTAQQQQQSTLNTEMSDKDRLVKTLKEDESKLVTELNRQQKSHDQLNKTIENIIRTEIAKKKKESRKPEALTAAKGEEDEALSGVSGEFVQRKGKLPWPVAKGYITRQFGTQPHPTLQGIKISNNGIDIRTDKGSEVQSIFEGSVVGTQFVPGYQNTVIVQHGIYYTVYSNLEEVFVKRGDTITARQIIGKVSSDKPEVHFEVWHEKERLNPVLWVSQPQ
ncbi:MAG: peptidoglycan DD-metalloendopeptidase family protein [Saprospiraceae bacterium]|nr:peptidoglycan DD-metalloendopeptidase family protein [Saprospiraceae bacterium]